MYDRPTARKVHTGQIPRIGGIAIFLSSTLLVMTVLFLDNAIGDRFRNIQIQIITLLIAVTFIFLVGFVDDMRGVRARYKLLAQIAAAGLICLSGARIESLNFANLFTLRFGLASFPLTILWIVGITNAVNLIDGLDGLAAGICTIACTVIAVFALVHGEIVLAVIMLALMGSLSGFLFFNFNPARIFMGDCGSMFLGFMLGAASVMCAMKSGTMVALALPAVVLGLPIFDTAFSILRRYLSRWAITSPDRGHLHHRLLDMGLRHRHVVIIMYAITVMAAGSGLFMMVTRGGSTVIVLFCIILLLLLAFRAVGAIRLRETLAKIKYNKAISREAAEDARLFQEIHMAFHRTTSFRQWWQMVSDAAEREDFSELCLTVTGGNGHKHKFMWRSDDYKKNHDEVVTVKLPISRRRFELPMEIEAKISVKGLLESTGRRMMLLGRLIDEYSGTELSNKAGDNLIIEYTDNRNSVETTG
ncbi:MAG: undecaprenyl/decaprenyl-phosphate alpha-N-acetylglucosaminyl 1-phosphate transferase [Sedimentisphaerales bacterium]|nr:undecaprenyl/decaprenyl-phosphate alpha-N-acetylglucosaminyl 1-phosphate transferase [Sedimentisphaerales bacterium]